MKVYIVADYPPPASGWPFEIKKIFKSKRKAIRYKNKIISKDSYYNQYVDIEMHKVK